MSDDLDDILNQALEEVEANEASQPTSSDGISLTVAASQSAAKQETAAKLAQEQNAKEPDFADMLQKMLSGDDAEFGKLMDDALKDLDSMPEIKQLMEQLQGAAGGQDLENMDEKSLQEVFAKMMSTSGPLDTATATTSATTTTTTSGSTAAGVPPLAGGGPSSEILEKMMAKIEADMGEGGMEKMMETMMKRMMSKEVMLEPITKIIEEYEPFLNSNTQISREDRSRYENQLRGYKALKLAYETDGDNFELISRILNDLQTFGQLPPSILAKISPEGFDPNSPTGLPGAGGAAPPGCPQQ
jgi:hypothetical protein